MGHVTWPRPFVGQFVVYRLETATILNIEKLRYFQSRLADFDEILHGDNYE